MTLLVVGIWGDKFVELQDKGHEIDKDEPTRPLAEYDCILGTTCWMMTPDHMKYLPLMLKAARERRYPK